MKVPQVHLCVAAGLLCFVSVCCANSDSDQSYLKEMRIFMKLYEDCAKADWNTCLKMKLISALDRVSKSYKSINVFEGVSFVNDHFVQDNGPALSEEYLEQTLQRSSPDKEETLNQILLEKISRFLSTYTLNIRLTAVENLRNTLGDARGKSKKYGYYFLLIPIMMAGTALPLALGALALLAGKALIISKLALLLAGIIGVKKLFGHHDHHGGQRQFQTLNHIPSEPQPLASEEPAHLMAYRSQVPAAVAPHTQRMDAT